MVGKDSGFSQLALGNEFYDMDYSDVKPQNLKEYIPIVFFSEIAIYQHKSQERIYVSKHKQGVPEQNYTSISDKNIRAFKKHYSWVWNYAYLNDLILFEDIESKFLLDTYFHM